MEALLNLVGKVAIQDQSQIIDILEARREVLVTIYVEMPERKESIKNEMICLSRILQKVAIDDYDGAVDLIIARKDELMDIHNYLTSLDEAYTADGDSAATGKDSKIVEIDFPGIICGIAVGFLVIGLTL